MFSQQAKLELIKQAYHNPGISDKEFYYRKAKKA